ncbi:MAG: WecB/TagA/CpsF family glycosyltransferase [Acidobacteria bacterium]|nr:WecB/TagA/CpsF family glycosyltransferase [Acidobacteriota bacterium]
MIDAGKHNILGILINALDYETAVDRVIRAGREGRGLAVSALAVHGLMTGVLNPEHKYRLNCFDLLVPDGQPVRWALNLLYKTRLSDRVYGPNLMRKVCARAAEEGLSTYFYGSTPEVLRAMRTNLEKQFPGLRIAGMEPSKFRQLLPEEKSQLATRIRKSGASIVLVGLGCPRQEVWAYEFRELLGMPALAVGAAFPFTAGTVRQAPRRLQDLGLEWAFRLYMEPRLWPRYVFLSPAYLFLVALQACGLLGFATHGRRPSGELLYG